MAWIGFGLIMTFMVLIMSRRLSAVVALILVPVIFALAAGFAPDELGQMIIKGITTLAPTAIMLMFAIYYFSLMHDVGLFDPMVNRIVGFAGNDPLRIAIGTMLLSAVVSLDGDGATTVLIVVTALLPIYKRVGMNPLILVLLLLITNTSINLVPWGGPTARAAAALHLDAGEIFIGLIPAMLTGLIFAFALAVLFGLKERKRLQDVLLTLPKNAQSTTISPELDHIRRPKLYFFNLFLTLCLIGGMATGLAPLPVLLMVGFAVALLVNYPKLVEQKQRIEAHSSSVIAVVSMIFAAGAFTGILNGTGMTDAMSAAIMSQLPDHAGSHLVAITAFLGIPMTFAMSNDAFFFGILPVIAASADSYGLNLVHIAQASVLGQMVHGLSPLVAAGYLMSGLVNRDIGEMQRFCLFWALLGVLLQILVTLFFQSLA